MDVANIQIGKDDNTNLIKFSVSAAAGVSRDKFEHTLIPKRDNANFMAAFDDFYKKYFNPKEVEYDIYLTAGVGVQYNSLKLEAFTSYHYEVISYGAKIGFSF